VVSKSSTSILRLELDSLQRICFLVEVWCIFSRDRVPVSEKSDDDTAVHIDADFSQYQGSVQILILVEGAEPSPEALHFGSVSHLALRPSAGLCSTKQKNEAEECDQLSSCYLQFSLLLK
jgi:hypothetical protein